MFVGLCATAIAVSLTRSTFVAAALTAVLLAGALLLWFLQSPDRWLGLFFFAALLLPPLPIALVGFFASAALGCGMTSSARSPYEIIAHDQSREIAPAVPNVTQYEWSIARNRLARLREVQACRLPSQLGHQVVGNIVAKLTDNAEF